MKEWFSTKDLSVSIQLRKQKSPSRKGLNVRIEVLSKLFRISLVVQWLRHRISNAWGAGLIPEQGTKILHVLWPPKKVLILIKTFFKNMLYAVCFLKRKLSEKLKEWRAGKTIASSQVFYQPSWKKQDVVAATHKD